MFSRPIEPVSRSDGIVARQGLKDHIRQTRRQLKVQKAEKAKAEAAAEAVAVAAAKPFQVYNDDAATGEQSAYQKEQAARVAAAQKWGMAPPIDLLLTKEEVSAIKATARPGIDIGRELHSKKGKKGDSEQLGYAESTTRGTLSQSLQAVRSTVTTYTTSTPHDTRDFCAPPPIPRVTFLCTHGEPPFTAHPKSNMVRLSAMPRSAFDEWMHLRSFEDWMNTSMLPELRDTIHSAFGPEGLSVLVLLGAHQLSASDLGVDAPLVMLDSGAQRIDGVEMAQSPELNQWAMQARSVVLVALAEAGLTQGKAMRLSKGGAPQGKGLSGHVLGADVSVWTSQLGATQDPRDGLYVAGDDGNWTHIVLPIGSVAIVQGSFQKN